MLLLELAVQQENRLAVLGRARLERLLKQVARALELGATLCSHDSGSARWERRAKKAQTYVALDKLAQVGVPDLEGDRVREEVDAALVDLRDALESAAPFSENQDRRNGANGSTALSQLRKADAP